jgi:ATP-dependent helicase/nuclease subunit B
MLTFTQLKHPAEKTDILELFDSNETTWVVSDLRNKFEIQRLILQSQDFYEDLSVIRASELWRILLKRSHPEMKFISSELISTWVKEETKRDPNLKLGNSAHQTVVEMMDIMASVHCHDLGADRLREWFRENPESLQRWGGWFLLSEKYSQELLEQGKISPKWSASYLQNEYDWKSLWQRPLIFDLGSQISQVEADLIRAVSRDIDVWVLAPAPDWREEYAYLLKPYDFLQSQATEVKKVSHLPRGEKAKSQAFRFSGVLGEAKTAVESVRKWLDAGVLPEQIGLIAPDMEKYWSLLQPLLEAEGIPYAKDVMSRLQSLPAVTQWLAQIRLAAHDVRYADLENALYLSAESGMLRFEEFYSLFAELMGQEDLRRHPLIEKSFQAQFSLNDEITRDEWLGFSLKCWKTRKNFDAIELCFREILSNTDASLKMRVSSWIHLLEQIVAKKEIRIFKGDRGGIQLANLSAGDSLSMTHRIFLGLTESMLKTTASPLLSPKEVMQISSELGFSLEHPEISSFEFDLAWLSENPYIESFYFYPQTGFSGGSEAPTALWLKKAEGETPLLLSHPTCLRWDAMLKAGTLPLEEPSENLKLTKAISLSPSSIESYRKCAFVFASQKLFRLQDLPVMDFDVDRRTRGSLAHALLEKLGEEPRKFDWKVDELGELIEGFRESSGLGKMDQFIWQGLKDKHIKLAQRFLSFEKEWRVRFPQTTILAREQDFEFFWDDKTQSLAKQGDWKIRGRIDRIDRDNQERLVLIDYKLSPGDYKNHQKWLEKNHLQLALYMLALEENVIAGFEAKEVIGAFYYVLKNMDRNRGLKVTEAAGTLFDIDKKKNGITEEKKTELLQAVKVLIQDVIKNIQAGQFNPAPLEPEKCGECNWKNLCRAPHLN